MSGSTRFLEQATKLANIILGGTGVACLVVLFYFVYHYSWIEDRQFINPVGMVMYYMLPAFSAGFLLVSLRMQPSHKINLSLFIVASAVSVYALEIFLNRAGLTSSQLSGPLWLHFPSDWTEEDARKRQKIAIQFRPDFDTRSRLEVVNDLRGKGIDAWPAIPSMIIFKKEVDGTLQSVITIDGTEVIPLGGISFKISVFCNENFAYTIYKTDKHGFHNPIGIWDSGGVDAVAVGDSFTHGACVPSDKNFVSVIRKRYSATINLGADGNGPLFMLAGIKEYAKHVKPKVVLWFYFEGNDFVDLMKEQRSTLLMRYLEPRFDQGLLSRQGDIDSAVAAYVEAERKAKERPTKSASLLQRLYTVVKLGRLRRRVGLIYGQSQHDIAKSNKSVNSNNGLGSVEPNMGLLRSVLLEARRTVSAWGGKLYFVYLPDWHRYAVPEVVNKYDRDRVLRLVSAVELPIIDVHQAFLAHGDPLALFPFRQFGHYNEKGHRLVAEKILRSLSLLPSDRSE